MIDITTNDDNSIVNAFITTNNVLTYNGSTMNNDDVNINRQWFLITAICDVKITSQRR